MSHQRIFLIFLLIMPASVLFVSCKKDADVTPNVIGKWQQSAFQYRIVYEVSGSKYDKTGSRNTTGGMVEFKEDGTATERGTTYTYTISGDQLTIRYGAVTTLFKITVTGDQLVMTKTESLIAGLSDADKLKEAKGWAGEINGSSSVNGVYTDINKATKADGVYSISLYQRVK